MYNPLNNNQDISIINHSAPNQKALDSVKDNDILPAYVPKIDSKKNTLMVLIEACREKLAAESPKYNRKKACLLIGYPRKQALLHSG